MNEHNTGDHSSNLKSSKSLSTTSVQLTPVDTNISAEEVPALNKSQSVSALSQVQDSSQQQPFLFHTSPQVRGDSRTVAHERECRKVLEHEVSAGLNKMMELLEKNMQATSASTLAIEQMSKQMLLQQTRSAEVLERLTSNEENLTTLKNVQQYQVEVSEKFSLELETLKQDTHLLKIEARKGRESLEQKYDALYATVNDLQKAASQSLNTPLPSPLTTSPSTASHNSQDSVDKMKRKIRLADYDGSHNAEHFVELVERTAKHNAWTEEETFLNVSAAIKGSAQTVKDRFPPGKKVTSTMLLDALKDRFGNQLRKEDASIKLAQRKQGKGETLKQLGADIEMLVNHAYPSAEYDTRDDIAKREFVRAIWHDELRKQVALKGPKNLIDAIHAAEEIEVTLRQMGGTSKAAIVMAVERDSSETLISLIKNMQGQLQRLEDRQERQYVYKGHRSHPSQESPINTGFQCYKCGMEGHIAKSCTSFQQRNQEKYHSNTFAHKPHLQGKGDPQGMGEAAQRK